VTATATGWVAADRATADVAAAVAVVDRSGAAELLEAEIAPRSACTGNRLGRPRGLSVRAFLAAAIATALSTGRSDLRTIHSTLNALPDDALALIGLARRADGTAASYSQLSRIWNQIADACNPSPVHEGKRLDRCDGATTNRFKARPVDPKHLDASIAAERLHTRPTRRLSTRGTPRTITADDAARRRALLDRVSDLLLQATIPAGTTVTALAVDWTDHEACARTYTERRTSADPDARWGRRRAKNGLRGRRHRPPADPDTTGTAEQAPWDPEKNEMYFGYVVHLAVTTRPAGGDRVAEIATGLRITPGNDMAAVAPSLLSLVDAARTAGHPLEEVLIDRGYSMHGNDRVHRPLAERGVHAVFDFAAAQYGRHGTHRDAPLIGGIPHCPLPPARLTNEPPPGPKASRDDWGAYWERRDRLDAYAFRPLGRRTPDLVQRYQCPAQAGKVRCPFAPKSVSLPADRDIPEIYPTGTTPPGRCCNTTFTARADVGLGARQRHPHGSRDWVRSYERRTSVERFIGSLKGQQRVGDDDIRVHGLARRGLMLTFAAAATNLRHLRNREAAGV